MSAETPTGDDMARERLRRGLTQAEACALVGITRRETWATWETSGPLPLAGRLALRLLAETPEAP